MQPRQIIIGSGAEYLYGMVAQFFGAGCIFGIEDPSYEKIRRVYESMGIVCDQLTLSADGIPSAELARTEARVLSQRYHHRDLPETGISVLGGAEGCSNRGG